MRVARSRALTPIAADTTGGQATADYRTIFYSYRVFALAESDGEAQCCWTLQSVALAFGKSHKEEASEIMEREWALSERTLSMDPQNTLQSLINKASFYMRLAMPESAHGRGRSHNGQPIRRPP